MDITACILSYNRPYFLKEALLSIKKQTLQPSVIKIYDNGSRSDVYDLIKDYLDDYTIWYGSNDANTVFWNFNRAIMDNYSKYIILMHDDDILCENFFEIQINILENNLNMKAISCNGYLINEHGIRIGKELFEPNDTIDFFNCKSDVALRYIKGSCIPFSPIIYRGDFVKMFKLNSLYEKHADVELLCRISDLGLIGLNNSTLYECRVHSEQDSKRFNFDSISRFINYLSTEINIKNTHNYKQLIDIQLMTYKIIFLKDKIKNSSNLKHKFILLYNFIAHDFKILIFFKILNNKINKYKFQF